MFKPRNVGWLVGLEQEGYMRVGATVYNTLKASGTEKRGWETKILIGEGASWAKGWVP